MPSQAKPLLVIACGALAGEILELKKINNWQHLDVQCLDAKLHNRPSLIPAKLQQKIDENRNQYEHIYIAYADCGTAGAIDAILEREGIERLPGAHCYSFFAGQKQFLELAERELGTFYLTDFLVRHFDRLIIKGFKLSTHPELRDSFFGHYRKLVYLSQKIDDGLFDGARAAADYLKLDFEHIHCGYGELETSLKSQIIAVG
ncbi:MAG: hypothetical protein ACJAUG_000492 [Halioglobus sp.]